LAVLEKKKITLEVMSSRLSEAKSPAYWNADASMTPLMMGPSVCPVSIMVAKKPKEEPTKPVGASSVIRGEVEEITMAKPRP
jgi:hypothetical protein